MNILVTGATGFVGQAIVEDLLSSRYNSDTIYCFGNKNASGAKNLPNFSKIDITDAENLLRLTTPSELDVVIHSAGLAHQFQNSATAEKADFYRVNVEATQNVLEFAALKAVRHFILISSVAVYGLKDGRGNRGNLLKKTDETAVCNPPDGYASSKLKAEKTAEKFCRENNICLTVLRLATVIGEGDGGNVRRLIEAIDKKRFLMAGRGENYKTLIYKRDVARACRIVLEKKDLEEKTAEIFNVAAEPVQMKYIVGKISESLRGGQIKIFLPFFLIYAPVRVLAGILPFEKIKNLRETLKKWTSDEIFSNEKIYQKYSFEPETTISEALEREVVSYKKQKC